MFLVSASLLLLRRGVCRGLSLVLPLETPVGLHEAFEDDEEFHGLPHPLEPTEFFELLESFQTLPDARRACVDDVGAQGLPGWFLGGHLSFLLFLLDCD